jgi:hypothetical protein
MYLAYGSYTHAANEANVVISRQPMYADGGIVRGYKETWRISGWLQADTTAELTTAINALKVGYSVQGQNVGLYLDDGTLTSHYITSQLTNGGVRVVDGPSFPVGDGTEYVSHRRYEIALEAELLLLTVPILAFHESLSFSGGGPRDVHLQPLTGLPVKQRVAQATPYRVSQTGSAIGQFSYPFPPPPIWPVAEMRDQRRIEQKSPKRAGPIGYPYFTEFQIDWSYQFEAAIPLVGLPHRFPG